MPQHTFLISQQAVDIDLIQFKVVQFATTIRITLVVAFSKPPSAIRRMVFVALTTAFLKIYCACAQHSCSLCFIAQSNNLAEILICVALRCSAEN